MVGGAGGETILGGAGGEGGTGIAGEPIGARGKEDQKKQDGWDE